MLDSVDLSDDVDLVATGPRVPPPVQPAQGAPVKRETQPSVTIEQAAKPNFYITVGDPHKVGDLTSSHIVYLVRTKVRGIGRLVKLDVLICLDDLQGVPSARIRSYEEIQRLSMALQFNAFK